MNINKKNCLLIAPTETEFNALKNVLQVKEHSILKDIELVKFETTKYNIFAIHGKVGKVNIAFQIGKISALIDFDLIINIGVAGSVSESLKTLDTFIANKACFYDCDLTAFNLPFGQMDEQPLYFLSDEKVINQLLTNNFGFEIKTGLIITADKFATSQNLTKELLSNFDNPIACDMESAAVAQCSYELNIHFFIIRTISDNVFSKENNSITYTQLASIGATKAIKVALKVLEII